MATGARAQQPTQPTVSSVTERSAVVSPSLIAELVLHLGQHGLGAPHMARRTHADLDDVLAPGLEMEMFVE